VAMRSLIDCGSRSLAFASLSHDGVSRSGNTSLWVREQEDAEVSLGRSPHPACSATFSPLAHLSRKERPLRGEGQMAAAVNV